MMIRILLIIIFLLSFGCDNVTSDNEGTTLGYTTDECVLLEPDCLNLGGSFTLTNPSNTNTWQGLEYLCVCQW